MDHRKPHERRGGKPPIVQAAILRRDPAHGSGVITFRRFVWNVKANRFLDAHDYGLKAFPIGKSR